MKIQKSILVIGGDSTLQHDIDDIAHNHKITEAALATQKIKVKLNMCPIDKVVFNFGTNNFTVTNGENKVQLDKYDLVIFKGVIRQSYTAQVITRYLKKCGIKYLNGYAEYRAVNKLIQLADMDELGLMIPDSVFCENKQLLRDQALANLKFPMIVKVLNSSGGRGIYKVDNKRSLTSAIKKTGKRLAMVQSYVANNGDYRILMIGDKSLIIHRQARPGSYLNNVAQGGDAKLVAEVDFPKPVLEDARKFQKQQELDIAGIDVMKEQKTGKFYFLEINSQPSLGGVFDPEKADLFGQLIKKSL